MALLKFFLNNKALSFFILFFISVVVAASVMSVKVNNLRSDVKHLTVRVSQLKQDSTTYSVQNGIYRNTIKEMQVDLNKMNNLLDNCGKGMTKELPPIDLIKKRKK